MIIGDKRDQVIDNIRQAAENKTFHVKVEVDDPVLTPEQQEKMLDQYLRKRKRLMFRLRSWSARKMADCAALMINRSTRIMGLENVAAVKGGAIITSNHFSPVDNTVVRTFSRKKHKKKLYIVSQATNLMMPGILGFFMNYADTIPLYMEPHYMRKSFEPMLRLALQKGNYVLIYPEQEMWFHYRKPRPLKNGAYHYAAKIGVPVLPCFVEITDLPKEDEKGFRKVRYTLHVLKPIYPDPQKTVKENRVEMCRQDYLQKKAAYEAVYHKTLDYHFNPEDIAGWIP